MGRRVALPSAPGGVLLMLRTLYDWVMRLAAHRHAIPALGLIAFIESAFFPIPPDVMLVPMILAKRARAWLIATVCTVSSVGGGVLGYVIGFFLFEALAAPIIEFYGYGHAFAEFREGYNEHGALIVAFFGVTFFPYKVITIASGVAKLDFTTFLIASVLSRGVRFYLEAALLFYVGEPIREFIERRLGLVTTVFVVLLIAGFAAIRFLI
jgi:membrane protein YqaA with SNARE-associated domain